MEMKIFLCEFPPKI